MLQTGSPPPSRNGPHLAAVALGCLVLFLATSSAGHAQASQEWENAEGWSFRLTPYLWMAGIEGDLATLGGVPPAEVDLSFEDLWDSLEFGLMSYLEARNGRFGILGELSYMRLSGDANTPGPLFDDAELTSSTLFLTGFGSYEAMAGQAWGLDALAGARLWHARTELDLNGGLLPGRSADDDETWVDPLIGARLRIEIGHGFSLIGLADIGGFNVGSDVAWEALGVLGYSFNDWLSAHAGYRHMKVDYENGEFLYDVELSGPIIGAMFRF